MSSKKPTIVRMVWTGRALGTHAGDQGQRLHRGMSLAQTPPGLPLTRRLPGGLACRGRPAGVSLPAKVRHAERRCPHERRVRVHVWATRRKVCARVAVTSGLSLEGSPYDVSRQGCRRSSMPREIRWAAGRRKARTAFPPAPGSRHRGSVGGRPRYGGRAACPPGPSDSPSLGIHEGARRPALFGGTSAGLALAPSAPFVLTVPHLGDNPTPIGTERHPAFYTQWASRGVTVASQEWCKRLGAQAPG
jgi:hypothetical protein